MFRGVSFIMEVENVDSVVEGVDKTDNKVTSAETANSTKKLVTKQC